MIFSSLPFHGIPPEAAAVCSHTFFRCRLLTAYQATTPHIPISSIESYHFPSVVFTRVCHPRSRSANFFCSLSSSFVFRCLRRRHSSSFNQTLLSNQSSLPLAPFPGNRRPRRFKQQHIGSKINVDLYLTGDNTRLFIFSCRPFKLTSNSVYKQS